MKAAVFKNIESALRIEAVDKPSPGRGELLLKVRACGICASDLHAAKIAGILPPDTIMGHEFIGEVEAIGEDVHGWAIGQRATALPDLSCGVCAMCMQGRFRDCSQNLPLGFVPQAAGAYAEYVRVTADNSLPIGDKISDADAAMIEPLAVGYDAVRRGRIKAADRVLVIGAGPIGLTVVQWCRFVGAEHVVASDLVASRLEVAKQVGATAVIDARESGDVIATYRRETGAEPNVIVEVVGAPGMIQRCIDMAPRGARIVVVGVCMQPDTIVPVVAIQKALDISFCYGYTREDWAFIVSMIEQGRIDPSTIVTAKVGFAEFSETFEMLKKPSDQLKVLLVP
jgi:(R,R)-butanediol dehydrogenase/meso-butanediol dehydrogenase/diacetyl reductase